MTFQLDWAWCSLCQTLHYAGFEGNAKGACAGSDTEHGQQSSPHYAALFDVAPRDRLQQEWASCARCRSLFYAGFPDHQGSCPAGGQHDRTGSFAYAVAYDDRSEQLEQGWACCEKCRCLHWAGQELRGACPAGGTHDTKNSFAYAVDRLPTEVRLRWTGLECRQRQESGPDFDDVFGGLAILTQDGVGSNVRVFPEDRRYWNLGAEDRRIVEGDIELYRGPAKGMAVTVTLTEWDSDPDSVSRYRDWLTKAGAQAAAAAADSYAPGSGRVATPVLEKFVGEVVDFVTTILGIGNDVYPTGSLTFAEADTVGAPADRHVLTHGSDPRHPVWTHVIELTATDDGGDTGTYAFYFLLDRAAPIPLWERERPYVRRTRRTGERIGLAPIGG